ATPPAFHISASTETCPIAAMEAPSRCLFAIQFHPEVAHTEGGFPILEKFVFDVCGCFPDWNPKDRIAPIEAEVRRAAAGRKVFFFVSGGVDSTVAYTLCLRALGPDRLHAIYVDTGLMRQGETESVRSLFQELGAGGCHIEHAAPQFLASIADECDPERK